MRQTCLAFEHLTGQEFLTSHVFVSSSPQVFHSCTWTSVWLEPNPNLCCSISCQIHNIDIAVEWSLIFSGSVSFSSEHFKGICSTVNLWSCFYLPVHWPIETSPISLRKINRELLASTHTSDLTHTPDPTHTADLTHCKHLVLLSFCVSASSSSPVLPDVIT